MHTIEGPVYFDRQPLRAKTAAARPVATKAPAAIAIGRARESEVSHKVTKPATAASAPSPTLIANRSTLRDLDLLRPARGRLRGRIRSRTKIAVRMIRPRAMFIKASPTPPTAYPTPVTPSRTTAMSQATDRRSRRGASELPLLVVGKDLSPRPHRVPIHEAGGADAGDYRRPTD